MQDVLTTPAKPATSGKTASARVSLSFGVMKLLRPLILLAGLAVLLMAAPRASVLAVPASPARADAASSAGEASSGEQQAVDETRAREVLAQLAAKFEYLEGTTVEVGPTPDGKEAVAYYTQNEIVVSDHHTVSIEKILAHEIWHIIDWHDNGRLDWGEDLLPGNAASYLK